MLSNKDIILRCCTLFLLFIIGSFAVMAIDKWRDTGFYDIERCTRPSNPFVTKKDLNYHATLQAYYFSNSSYLLEPVKLYYPAMYPFLSMTSKNDAWNWVRNVQAESVNGIGIFDCMINKSNSIGITERYPLILGWIFLLILVIFFIIYITVNIFRNIRGILPINRYLYFTYPNGIPPRYALEDPELPDYERGSYDRTPPSDDISIDHSISNSSSMSEFSV